MTDKAKALQNVLGYLSRTYGQNSVVCLGDNAVVTNVEVVSSGLGGLDRALGVGGLPRGRILEIFGPESAGKTTLALMAAAAFQAAGETVAMVDAEHALDVSWAQRVGVDTNKLLINQPASGDEALDVVERLVSTRAVGLIIVDSVAALTPRAELEAEPGQELPGVQARMMSNALRKLAGAVNISKTTVIFINQLRHKLMAVGNPETTTGGNALKFYASMRLDVRLVGMIKDKADEKKVVGRTTRVRVVKNKLAPPFREAMFNIDFNTGVDRGRDMLDQGVELKVLEVKDGGRYFHKGKAVAHGSDAAAEWLRADGAAQKSIRAAVDAAIAKSKEAAKAAMTAATAGDDDEEPPADEE